MASKLATLIIYLIISTYASVGASPAAPKTPINWLSCTQNGTSLVTCARLSVPLDYSDSATNATIDLSLVKVNAVKQPCKGSIILNNGGPGDLATAFVNGPGAKSLLE